MNYAEHVNRFMDRVANSGSIRSGQRAYDRRSEDDAEERAIREEQRRMRAEWDADHWDENLTTW